MKRIYKYLLNITNEQILTLPSGSRILSVEGQRMTIVLYALVENTVHSQERYSVIVHGTGHPSGDVDDYIFLGTVKMDDGYLMFHVFYKKLES